MNVLTDAGVGYSHTYLIPVNQRARGVGGHLRLSEKSLLSVRSSHQSRIVLAIPIYLYWYHEQHQRIKDG